MTEKTDNASLCFVFHYLDIFLSYLIVRNDHTKFVFIDTQGSWLDFQNCGCRFSAMLIPKKLKIGREFDIKIEGSNLTFCKVFGCRFSDIFIKTEDFKGL